jgi:shikimate dehydrogenase/3-dehydroquinate dehydratase type I
MICLPVIEATQKQALLAIDKCARTADAVELRMDVIADGEVDQLIARSREVSAGVKIIVTCRRKEESLIVKSGEIAAKNKTWTKAAKMELFCRAVLAGADFIDIELAEGNRAIQEIRSFCRKHKSSARIIVSWHDVSETPLPVRLKEIFQACAKTGADIVKIVPYARTTADNLRILRLIDYAKEQGSDIIAMCMGDEGKISRVLAPSRGSYLGFAVLAGGQSSAPGQLTIREMREYQQLLRGQKRSNDPGCASPGELNLVLLGNPVRQSLSPLMHNNALETMRIAGHYSAFCVNDLTSAVAGIRGMNIRGASVTIPFKTAVMEYLDEIDEDAAALGAVNTIVNKGGHLVGYNTDWVGLMQALKVETDIAGKEFVVLGAGGAARAAAYGIKKEGGRPIIVNRTREKGEVLAQYFDCPFYPLAQIGKIKAAGLINTTSVGMYPDINQSLARPSAVAHYRIVVDVIYNPLKTKLLRDAEAKGCKILAGLEMFVRQGAAQLKLWTGREAPLELMKKTVRERLMNIES